MIVPMRYDNRTMRRLNPDVTTLGSYSRDGNRQLHQSSFSRPPAPRRRWIIDNETESAATR